MPLPETVFGKHSSIVITGASSGIGAALARELAPHGGQLALVARREDRLQQLADEVRKLGGSALAVAADVTDLERVRAASDRIVAAHGPVDAAFLNAGTSDMVFLHRFEAARLRQLFEVNVFGVLNWLEVLLPEMISRGRGIIAGTSSLAAGRGLPGNSGYAASKAAVSTLLDGIRVEGQQYGLQITVVEPGFVKSELTEGAKVPMPFMMETRAAARLIVEGVAEGKSLVRFPWQTTAMARALHYLPNALFDKLAAKMIKKRRQRSSKG